MSDERTGKHLLYLELAAIVLICGARLLGMPLPAWMLLCILAASASQIHRAAYKPTFNVTGSFVVLALAAATGIGYQFFTIFIEGPLIEWIFGTQETLPPVNQLTGDLGVTIVFVFLAIGFAAGEEFAFRGYVLERISVALGQGVGAKMFALVASSMLFSLVHTWQNLPGLVGTFLAGLLFGTAYLVSGRNVIAASVTHFASNLTAIVLAYFGMFVS